MRIGALLLAVLATAGVRAQLPQDQIFRMNNPAVFQLTVVHARGDTTVGTAFCVRQDGILATTWSLVADAATASVRSIYDKNIRVLGVLARDEEHDLAIIKVDDGGLSEVQLGQSTYTTALEMVFIIGSAAPSKNVMDRGTISADFRKAHDAEELQPVIPVEGEFSARDDGGPILSGSGGRAIGVMMTTAAETGEQGMARHVAVVIPVEELRAVMARQAAQPSPLHAAGNYFDTPEGKYWSGRLEEVNDSLAVAVEHFRVVLAARPQSANAAFQLAYVLERLGRHDEAAKAYGAFNGLDPGSPLGFFNVGLIHAAAGRWSEAERALQTAADRDVRFVKAWDKLGFVLEREGQSDRALAAYLHARDAKETDIASNMRIATILHDKQKWSEAAKAAKKGREAGIDSVQVYFLEADSYLHIRNYLQAWDLAHRGTERDANDARLWAIMAESSARSRNPDRAKEELTRLRTLDAAAATRVEAAIGTRQ